VYVINFKTKTSYFKNVLINKLFGKITKVNKSGNDYYHHGVLGDYRAKLINNKIYISTNISNDPHIVEILNKYSDWDIKETDLLEPELESVDEVLWLKVKKLGIPIKSGKRMT